MGQEFGSIFWVVLAPSLSWGFNQVSQGCSQMKAWWGWRMFPSSLALLLTGVFSSLSCGPLHGAAQVSAQHGSQRSPHGMWSQRARKKPGNPLRSCLGNHTSFLLHSICCNGQTLMYSGLALTKAWSQQVGTIRGLLGSQPPWGKKLVPQCSLRESYGMRGFCIDKEVETVINTLWRIRGIEKCWDWEQGHSFSQIMTNCGKGSLVSLFS